MLDSEMLSLPKHQNAKQTTNPRPVRCCLNCTKQTKRTLFFWFLSQRHFYFRPARWNYRPARLFSLCVLFRGALHPVRWGPEGWGEGGVVSLGGLIRCDTTRSQSASRLIGFINSLDPDTANTNRCSWEIVSIFYH